MDRFTVYNAEKKFVGSTHLVAPYIKKRERNSKKVVLRNKKSLLQIQVFLIKNHKQTNFFKNLTGIPSLKKYKKNI